jgi:NAD(P)-dependent dehydrogenase (short-subunit alcohol dehydrogenase family)
MSKTWFITGTSRGFGYEWTKAALDRGDKVAATARNLDSLKDLTREYKDRILPIKLDVTNRGDDMAAVKTAFDHFGEIDVIINNAGYGLFGAVEEVSESEARAQIETNVFGPLWISQAALPYLRAQGHGHILQVSSIGGVAAFAGIGMYHASKWALEGFSEALSQEVAPFGIHVTIIEPGGFETDWSGSSSKHASPIEAYDNMRASRMSRSTKRGDPRASAEAILKVVDSDNPPLRLLLGEFATQIAPQVYAARLKTWTDWDAVSKAADGD